jgi:hypothetical protein
MMTNKKLMRLAQRRQLLITQASAQRNALAQNVIPLRNTLALADSSIRVVRYVKSHPMLSLAATAAFAYVQAKLAGRWLQRGLVLLTTVRNLRGWLLPDKN